MPRRPPPTPHRRWPAALLALLAAAALAACGAQPRTGDADLQVRWSLVPDPPRVGVADVGVEVSDVDWTPRNGATVIVTGLRDSVSLVVDTAVGQGAGRYVAPSFRFEVAGDWVLRARIETLEGRWVEVERAVRVEAGPS